MYFFFFFFFLSKLRISPSIYQYKKPSTSKVIVLIIEFNVKKFSWIIYAFLNTRTHEFSNLYATTPLMKKKARNEGNRAHFFRTLKNNREHWFLLSQLNCITRYFVELARDFWGIVYYADVCVWSRNEALYNAAKNDLKIRLINVIYCFLMFLLRLFSF